MKLAKRFFKKISSFHPYYIDFIFCTKYYFNMWDFTHGME